MNPETNIQGYTDTLGNLKLSTSARVRIQKNLLEYARFNDVRVGEDSRSIQRVPLVTSITNILNFKLSYMTLVILIALVLGGGTTYAAESAVPGDLLYSVKVDVNENVRSAFAVSNESEARLQARLAEERLEEAEELAARGELKGEVTADLSARLKTHYDAAEARNQQVEAAGDYVSAATVRASLEGTFRSYADTLAHLNTNVAGNDGATLIADIQTYADASAQAQANVGATIGASAQAQSTTEATVGQVDGLIARVETKLSRSKDVVAANVQTHLEARLNEAREASVQAKADLQAKSYTTAYASVQTAVRLAAEVETMLETTMRFQDWNLNGNGALDAMINGSVDSNDSTGDDTTATSSTATTSTTTNQTSSTSVNVDVDASLDTDVLDTEIRSDSEVNSTLSL
jgi:Domain of unknown function (DUF5667)